jgi:oxygen-independent coproporphyrinogen-3 oxidase
MGLSRYEISNYALPGRECRHKFAVWRGEDYAGLGEGACGRIRFMRTRSCGTPLESVETVSPDFDRRERRIFRLRTREGLDAAGFPEWTEALNRHVDDGLLTCRDGMYRLTPRGMEVCDAILADLAG